MRKIIGIDPGLNKTGWGVVALENNSLKFVACGTIYTSTDFVLAKRLHLLHEGLLLAIKLHSPTEAAIEETFVNINPASSLKLGHARGSLILSLGLSKIPVFEYSATAIKKTVVGVGRAEKHQIGMMVKMLLPKAEFKTEDEADALAAAICHINHRNY